MQPGVLWQTVLGEIELSVSHGNFVTWFKNTNLIKHEGDSLVVGVPNIFIKQQLERKYGDLITKTLGKNGVSVSSIEYRVAQRVQADKDRVMRDEPRAGKSSRAA